MSEPHVLIQYVGGLPRKPDNIMHGSGRVWDRKFASLRIPEREAGKYLAHPLEFRLTTPQFLLSPNAETLSKDEQVYALLSIVGSLELHAAEEVLHAAQERVAALQTPLGKTQVSAADRPRFNERKDKIRDAIMLMDPTNPTDYTDTGNPRVARVNELSGLGDATAAEIREVVRETAKA